MTIDKAVILAAGSGHRISRVGSTPKPLLPLDGRLGSETFLHWHIARLAEAGVRDITIVGNLATVDTPLPVPPGVCLRWVLNPSEDLSLSGSGHSAWFAWTSAHGILDGRSRVLLMDADILYEPAVLRQLVDHPPAGRSVTLVCAEYRESDEEVMVFADGDRVVMHGKGLLGTEMARGLRCLGEATGMVLFDPADHAFVRSASDWAMRFSRAKECSEHEDVTQLLMRHGRIEARCFDGLLFMECDTPEEYEVLTGTFYPRVRSLAASGPPASRALASTSAASTSVPR